MEKEESRDLEAEAAELEERERTLRAEREALAEAEAELAAEQERLNWEEQEQNKEFCQLSQFCHSVTEGKNSNSAISGIFGIFAPMVRTQKQLCEFPVDALPDKISPYIQATAESLQVSVDMVATFVIAIISLCVQGKYKIQVKPDWEEPVNLYAVVVMRPSERKSPTLKMVSAPVFEYMDEENERRQPEIAEYETKKKILTGQIKNISNSIAGSYKKDNNKYTMEDILECQEELRKLEEEGIRELKLIVDDVTPEALVSTMKENNDRIGIVSAEGGIFGTMAGRYNDHTNIDIFLKGYSGEYYSTARIGRQGNTLKHPLITIVLAVQPQVICDIMDNKEFSGRGLLARFLYSIPNSLVGSRKYRTEPVNKALKEEYNNLIKDLLKTNEMDFDRPIRLSEEADLQSEIYNQQIERRLTDDLEQIEEWAGKLHGNTMRIAAIFHIVKYGWDAVNVPLEAETLAGAIKVGQYYLEHSMAAFDMMGLSDPQDVKDAKYIISRIEQNTNNTNNTKNSVESISKREVWQLCKGHFKSVEEMEPGLQVLVERGYIAIQKEKPAGRGRPSEQIYINPAYYQWKEEQRK